MTAGRHAEGARLALDGVGKRFQARDRVVNALEATSLMISDGEFVTLVGPSGCGKSTLLNIISGLTPASEGSVLLDGNAIVGVNRRVGYITQQDNLFPWRTLRENVALPLELAGVAPKERREQSRSLARPYGQLRQHLSEQGFRRVRSLFAMPPLRETDMVLTRLVSPIAAILHCRNTRLNGSTRPAPIVCITVRRSFAAEFRLGLARGLREEAVVKCPIDRRSRVRLCDAGFVDHPQ